MATLTAFRFDTVDGADNALGVISMLQEQELIAILDAALVSWPKGKNRPSTRQVVSPTGTQLLDGTFWGMLFGLIFFVPVLDAGCRAEADRLTSALSDVGIDDTFIYQVRSRLTEGTSALFVLSQDAVMDRINDALKGKKPDLIAINLPHDEEMKLRNLFGPASTPPPRARIATS
jgi:uncharacterized membrane protein